MNPNWRKYLGLIPFGNSLVRPTLAALSAGLLLLIVGATGAAGQENGVPVVPIPVKALLTEGAAFQVTPNTMIVRESDATETKAVADRAVEALRRVSGLSLRITSAAGIKGNIVLQLDRRLFSGKPDWQRDEGYRLSASASGVEVSARTTHGLFNGVQTLAQLVTQSNSDKPQIPACAIEDYPRFQWRALLLDPARHFLPPDYLKKFIEVMAFYKYNRLQLHLTDDQGWRLEIKKYPRLTQIGSVRKQSPKRGDREHGDGQVYGPFFYTQDQIRELVAYAKARHVTLVPEIEIPGHFGAAIAAHPEFSCAGRPSEVQSLWGINADILCPGNDAAVAFAKDVLGEVCALFPSEFIHIGGDEVPRERWKTCPKCQARMKAEGLKNEAQLQSWLNHRLEEFLVSKGRRMIGWDEILEGGLTPGAVVMSWRGSQGGIDAAKAGHDVIMSPTTHCYFDYAQAKGPNEPECIGGFIPLATVHSFEPVPPELSASQRQHILGAQGNIWGEYIWDGNDVEYFTFPRALALAEVVWSPAEGRSFEGFVSRLNAQYVQLDRLRVNYRKPDAETVRRAPEAKAENQMIQIRETTRTIPFHRPLPLTSLPLIYQREHLFPYTSYGDTETKPEPRAFRMVVLENDALRVEVAPELGGRVYSLFDKRLGKEILFSNPVVKPVRILPIWAFISGGIEFNFPIAHSPTSVAEVGCATGRIGDYGFIRVGEREARTGMEWVVELGLMADQPLLIQRTALRNKTVEAHPWMMWTICAVRSTRQTEFVHPPHRVLVHNDRVVELGWPGDGLNWDRHYQQMTALFWKPGSAPQFGAFHHDLGFGLMHLADPTQLPGKKLWTYGHGAHRAWGQATTEGGLAYCEIESGPLLDQSEKPQFPAGTERRYTEFWAPMHSRAAGDSVALPSLQLPEWPDPWLGWKHSAWQTEWEAFRESTGPLPASIVPTGIALETALRRELARGNSRAAEPLALWLAFHKRPKEALSLIEHSREPTARRLAGLILSKGLQDSARAIPFLEAGPLHDPVAVVELDELYSELGLTAKRSSLLAKSPSHRLIIERRADLALALGRPKETLQLLDSIHWPREHQRYVRTTLWKKARSALGLSDAEVPETLNEDNLAQFGAYWSDQ